MKYPGRPPGGPLPSRVRSRTFLSRPGSRCLLAVMVLFALLQVWRAAGPGIGSDEHHYYFSARQMAEGGSWLTPVNQFQEIRVHKPPLVVWLFAALFKLTGPSLFVQRLAPILAAAASAWVLYLLVFLLTGSRRTSSLSSIIFLGSVEFIVTNGLGRMDSLFLLLIITANYLFCRILMGRPHKLTASLLAYFCLGLAFLAKGPNGLLHTLLPAAGLAAWRPRLRADLIYILHPLGWLVLAGLVLPWYLALLKVHGPGVWPLITGDLVKHGPSGNLLVNSVLNLIRYPLAMRVNTLPWWPFLLLRLLSPSRLRRFRVPAAGELDLFPLLWLLAVALTTLPNPVWHRRYVLYALPALSLYGAGFMARLEEAPAWIKERAYPWTVRGLAVVLAAFGLVPVVGHLRFGSLVTTPLLFPFLTGAAVLGLGLGLWRSLGRGSFLGVVTCLAALSLIITVSFERNFSKITNRTAAAGILAAEVIRPLDPDRAAVYAVGLRQEAWALVADRSGYWPLALAPGGEPAQWPLDRLLEPDGKGREVYLATEPGFLEKLEPGLKPRLEVVAQRTHRPLFVTFPQVAGLYSRTVILARVKPPGKG